MPKVNTKKKSPNWGAVKNVTDDMANKDRIIQEKRSREKTKRAAIPLSQIKIRKTDTRPLHEDHVNALSESIAVLGLLEPLVVDKRSRLLAGGHRLAAINVLKSTNSQVYQQHFPEDNIPVRVMDFDAEENDDLALQVEVAENEHRRDYTPKEVRLLADRLQAQGYKRLKGRPGKGEKSMILALAFVVNKSKRTIERYLQENSQENNQKNQKSTTGVALSLEKKNLTKTYTNLQNWQNSLQEHPETPKRQALLKKLPRFMKAVDAALTEVEAEIQIQELELLSEV